MTTDDETAPHMTVHLHPGADDQARAAHDRALDDLREKGYQVTQTQDMAVITPPSDPNPWPPQVPSCTPKWRRYDAAPALGNVVRINPNHPSVASEPDRQLQPYDQDNDGSDGEPHPIIRTYDDVGDPLVRWLTVHEDHVGEAPQSPKVVRVCTFGPSGYSLVDLSPAMATQFALAVLAAATKAGE